MHAPCSFPRGAGTSSKSHRRRWLPTKFFRPIAISVGALSIVGCAQLGPRPGIERADDLGLQAAPGSVQQLPPLPPLPDLSSPLARDRLYRDAFVEQWMARSDLLCREYKDKIILVSRSTRFASDATSTILSGLATIFTAVGTIHPLTGAATIVSGVGAAAQTDTFAQQSGEIIASAIQTSRENQANQIEFNLQNYGVDKYNIYRAQRDVIAYHNMCSLENALAQVRSSLKTTSPGQGTIPPAAQGVEPAAPVPPAVAVNPAPPPPPPAIPHFPTEPPRVNPRPIAGIIDAASPAEKSLTPAEGRKIQAALCVPPDPGTVTFGSKTRAAIDLFRTTGGHQGPPGGLRQNEALFLMNLGPCDPKQFANVFEYIQFRTDRLGTSADKIGDLQKQLHVPVTGVFDPATRAAISELQTAGGMQPTGQVTRDFFRLLINVKR